MRLGILGVGNMGEAILRGVLKGEILGVSQISIYDVVREKVERLSGELGVRGVSSIADLVDLSDAILYSAKPQNVPEVLPELARHMKPPKFLISIAAGVKTGRLESFFSDEIPVVRVMPNIAALIGESASAVCPGRFASREHLDFALRVFRAVGRAIVVEERLMDAVTGLSGSGPAFIFLIIEALADAGVQLGLPSEEATTLAIQTVLGAAKLISETGEHPALLKNRVTSPGGTTAAGVFELESSGVRAAVMKAVIAAAKRSEELGG
ncbi:TPA: pyrroline-5-carboxylate reductase [Candidatus Poribacteria bacterium]|nr:pyrroline-5-carboxylate reductase [Candidatus Poribacteria bacterium]